MMQTGGVIRVYRVVAPNKYKGSARMKNEYRITRDLFRSWGKEFSFHGGAYIFLFVLWCVVGVSGLAGIIFSVAMDLWWIYIYIWSLILAMAIFKLFFQQRIIWSRRYALCASTYGVAEWMRTTEFLEDEIVLTDHTSVNRFKYNSIRSIKEKHNAVLIFMNQNMALRLYKDAFVTGSWEDCKKMILEKAVLSLR